MKIKKWMLWTGLGILGAGAVAGITAGVVIAVQNNNKHDLFKKTFYAFNPKVKTSREGFTFDLNPETNTSSSVAYKKIIKEIAKNKFQSEISQNLQQFYEAYELEHENGSNEFEAEIEKITVKDVKFDESITTITPFGKWIINVDVRYKIEEEKGETDKEWFDYQNKNLTLIPSLAGQAEIDLIVEQLRHYHGIAQDAVEDLREIYFGDRDDDGSYRPYLKASGIDWEDSKGVLTYLRGFINNINPYAKMSGWKINISELLYTKQSKVSPDPTKEIWAPSAINTSIYYPDVNADDNVDPGFNRPNNSGLQWEKYSLAWNMVKLRSVALSDFKTKLGINGVNGNTLNVTELSNFGIKLPGDITNWRWEEERSEIDFTITTNKGTFKFELEKNWFK